MIALLSPLDFSRTLSFGSQMGLDMAVTVTPLHPHLGAKIRGVDLTRSVMPQVFAEIEAALNRHGILVFPEQPVTDEQQLAFSRLFGRAAAGHRNAGSTWDGRRD